MTTLIIDGHNFMHRARSGFQLGPHNVVFNTMRTLKPVLDKFEPDRVIFTLEGHPQWRYDLLPTYKANRHVIGPIENLTEKAQKKLRSDEDFYRQKDIIVDVLARYFPMSLMRHPDHEADDLVYNVIANAAESSEFIVVSTDTDFIQLLQGTENVRLYNPVTKAFVEAPPYDYVQWKALRGDGSDNVKGIPGVNDEKAVEILTTEGSAVDFLSDEALVEQWRQNCNIIRFVRWTNEEALKVTSSAPQRDWPSVARLFEEWAFKSILKEPYWTAFKATFDRLWVTK